MNLSNLFRKIKKNILLTHEVYQAEGIIPSFELVTRTIGTILFGISHRGHPRINIALNRMTDVFYDFSNGVDTGGMIDLPEMDGCGRNYVGTPPRAWKLVFRHLNIDYSNYTYIDFGCGKGRTMILAAQNGFKRVIGVDISPQLLKIAKHNFELKHIENELLCSDVRDYVFPDGNLVLFMYNPFFPDVMLQVAENIKKSLINNPRDIYIVYYSAACKDIWKSLGFTAFKETYYAYPNYVIFHARSFAP